MFKLLQDFIQRLAHVLSGTPEEVRRIDALAEDRTINPYYRPMLMMQEFFKFEAGGGLLLFPRGTTSIIVCVFLFDDATTIALSCCIQPRVSMPQ